MDGDLLKSAESMGAWLMERQAQVAVAESCTGGLIAQALTELAGSSAWFERGFVTYSNLSKIELLGVRPETLASYGAVSQETALEMVVGVLHNSAVHYALAVTGIAGPSGGSIEKPVGTVFIAWAQPGRDATCEHLTLKGGRQEIRLQAARRALAYWLEKDPQ